MDKDTHLPSENGIYCISPKTKSPKFAGIWGFRFLEKAMMKKLMLTP